MKLPAPTARQAYGGVAANVSMNPYFAAVSPQVDLLGGRAHVAEWVEGACVTGGAPQVSQCLNDIENMPAWDGMGLGAYRTGWTMDTGDGPEAIFHASAGVRGGRTCTLFYRRSLGDAAQIVAVGHHTGPNTYGIDWKINSCANIPNNINLNAPQDIQC